MVDGLLEYPNVPPTIGAVISCDKATLRECQEFYSIEDIYLLLEISGVDAKNRMIVSKSAKD